jgi:hypothetical protein
MTSLEDRWHASLRELRAIGPGHALTSTSELPWLSSIAVACGMSVWHAQLVAHG